MQPRRLLNWSSAAVMLISSSSCSWELGILGTLGDAEKLASPEEEKPFLSSDRLIPVSTDHSRTEHPRMTHSSSKNPFTSASSNWKKLFLERNNYVKPGDVSISPDNSKPQRVWPTSRQTSFRRLKGTVRNSWERLPFSKFPTRLNANGIHEEWDPGMLITNDAQAESYVEKFDPVYFKEYLSRKENQAKRKTKELIDLQLFGALAGPKVAKSKPQHLINMLKALEPVFSHTDRQGDIKISAMPEVSEPLVLMSSTTDRNRPEVIKAEKSNDRSSTKIHPSKNNAAVEDFQASRRPGSVIEDGKIGEKQVWEDKQKMLQLKLGSVHSMVLRLPEDLRNNLDLTDAIHEVYSLIWWRNKLTYPGISLVDRLNKELNMKLPKEAQRNLVKPEIFFDG